MDTKDFKDLCDRLLKKYGFKKLPMNDVFCLLR